MYDFYKVLHVLGLSLVVLSLGGIILHVINGGSKATNSFRKGAMITHGIGLVLLLVAGFGMLARLGIHGVPLWVGGKLLIWLVLGAFVGLAYKKQALAKKFWLAIPVLVLFATALAVFKTA
jgi:hypothetical protein